MIETYGNPIGGGTNIKTLPMQISNLAATAGTDGIAGYIDVSFNEPPATSWGLVKNYIIVYKEDSIPTSPFDGYRVIADKVAASGKIEKRISGLTFDQLYGIRIFPFSVDNKYQTSVTGSTATATPVAGIDLGSLSIGDRVAIPVVTSDGINEYGDEIIWKVIDKNHPGYPDNSITIITDRIITLKCFDAKESSNSDRSRRNYGNNRYIYSNVRQWLNSNADAGNWYNAQHVTDAPPNSANVWDNKNEYETEAGFLSLFSENMILKLLTTNLKVMKADFDGGGTESFSDTVFLASCTEMGVKSDENTGAPFYVFAPAVSRQAYPTTNCVNSSEYKSDSVNASLPWNYLLRDAHVATSGDMHYITSDGRLEEWGAFRTDMGIRPLCNLSQDFILKTEPRADGIYEPVLA